MDSVGSVPFFYQVSETGSDLFYPTLKKSVKFLKMHTLEQCWGSGLLMNGSGSDSFLQ
jgi:hypothetical protein